MHTNWQYFLNEIETFFRLAFPTGVKVVMAIICGGLIGFERELKRKPAGIKTNILICLGATLYTIMSVQLSQLYTGTSYNSDPSRIAAQIVSGIGFIGAGAIMQSKITITGLTTAATIWIVAAIGVCIGGGYPLVAFVFTVTVLFTLLIINKIESKFLGRTGLFAVEIIYEDEKGAIRSLINQAMTNNEISLDDFDISQKDHRFILRLQYTNAAVAHKRFVLDLWNIKGVREVKQL